MPSPFRTGSEIIVALTEEVGEVACEVALLERVGSKADWERAPDRRALATEIRQVINLLCVLANHFEIDLEDERPGE
jgi:NTP pyrophosphatase (non-canonical NTP hydrolase)